MARIAIENRLQKHGFPWITTDTIPSRVRKFLSDILSNRMSLVPTVIDNVRFGMKPGEWSRIQIGMSGNVRI